jgi:DNA polymerase-3 subunit gamma/tau
VVTALYRRYRPETFAELIGQSQVTDPLTTALRTDRVNHAYLFSGPRGCGKTTSARILARCLNCHEGPTDTPCDVCPSCVELSRDGSGSLDVVEIDAASHNGVDDARDLRERAVFAPARDRYKIFILDEAHMVTPQGFNALLKIVEEPPEHIKFIFATTEPDKVIGTIRSRTHHYPFRLVPPAQMLDYVGHLCESEGVKVEAGVLPLVVRAGGGSVRDTLSLLDQLIAGSEGDTVVYERAVALLGYTHGALLGEVIDALGAKHAESAFEAIDRVIQTGQDPRRFVEDLLERLRDLIVVSAFPAGNHQAAAAVLRGVQPEELDTMAQQAARFGQAELSRTADLVAHALTEMTGATSPRLHLELMAARVLVPASDETERGALARVERLERRVGVSGPQPVGGAEAPAPVSAARPASVERPAAEHPAASVEGPRPTKDDTPAELVTPAASAPPLTDSAPSDLPVPATSEMSETSEKSDSPESPPAASVDAVDPAVTHATPVGPVTVQQVRDAWPQVLDHVQQTKRTAWMVLFTAQVRELRDGEVLVLEFPSQKDVEMLKAPSAPGEGVGDYLKRGVAEVLGFTPKLIARVAVTGSASGDAAPQPPTTPATVPPAPAAAPTKAPAAAAPAKAAKPAAAAPASTPDSASSASDTDASGGWATVAIPGASTAVAPEPPVSAPIPTPAPTPAPAQAVPSNDEPPFDDEPPYDPDYDSAPPPADRPSPKASAKTPAKAPAKPASSATAPRAASTPAQRAQSGGSQKYGEAVVRQVLGATFIEEQPHNPRVTPGAN